MKQKIVRTLAPGFYKLHWTSGGTSYAAVGVTEYGGRWIAPCNWVQPPTAKQLKKYWKLIYAVELIVAVGSRG